MLYTSTRGKGGLKSAHDLLTAGTASDGGLYVPQTFPAFSDSARAALQKEPYAQAAYAVLAPFCNGLMEDQALHTLLRDVYRAPAFTHPEIVPRLDLEPDFSLLELFHGPTLAFKDVALQFLGALYASRPTTFTFLGATSGDTGSAAIAGCQKAQGRIFILYPDGRPSDVQRKQMTTWGQPHIHALALDGHFDDCQSIVKKLFSDKDFAHTHSLTAVNSINWFRILAQIVYYARAAFQAYRGTPVHFAVPTGNFGNVYAGYLAKRMGAPIGSVIIATNKNDTLPRFFETGTLTSHAPVSTLSPSMDIQIPSNFERYLFDLCKGDAAHVETLMRRAQNEGTLTLPPDVLAHAQKDFLAVSVSDAETMQAMKDTYDRFGVLIDPHTAVGVFALQKLRTEQKLQGPAIALACAHAAKFPETVIRATRQTPENPPALTACFSKQENIVRVPAALDAVRAYILNHKDAR